MKRINITDNERELVQAMGTRKSDYCSDCWRNSLSCECEEWLSCADVKFVVMENDSTD